MRTYNLAGLAVVFAALSGCAPMRDMGSSDIQLSVTPAAATCEARQNGVVVGQTDANRQTVTVPKSPGSTEIFCYASGYKDKRITLVPDSPAWFDALLVDFGPVNKATYPANLQIVMEPGDRPQQPR